MGVSNWEAVVSRPWLACVSLYEVVDDINLSFIHRIESHLQMPWLPFRDNAPLQALPPNHFTILVCLHPDDITMINCIVIPQQVEPVQVRVLLLQVDHYVPKFYDVTPPQHPRDPHPGTQLLG